MSLSLRIICSPDSEAISEWTKTFPEEGGTIGRGFGTTFQLSDAERTISSVHASIVNTDKGLKLIDNSTNGVFINGADSPIGKGNQESLRDGDVITIGSYRLLVSYFSPDDAKAEYIEDDVITSPQEPSLQEPSFILGNDPFLDSDDVSISAVANESVSPSRHPDNDKNFSTNASDFNTIEKDPFHLPEKEQESTTLERAPLTQYFEDYEDDPFHDTLFSQVLDLNKKELSPHSASESKLVQLYRQELQQKRKTQQAMEMALTRLLKDMAPESLEPVFEELSPPRLWHNHWRYWTMYKHYFSHQLKSRDWHIKFHFYFQESLGLHSNDR
ncbi:type VI secretion system-associated FHA domain protein [Parashewanella tropica]|uniref:type VI secretion system-associated FHA domain protein n=1 Tax=Parashewanella tropica TaxID=2547970 RepID=UPI00105A9660|nr:FHA domain-containing protein [Parashewanella tropica]